MQFYRLEPRTLSHPAQRELSALLTREDAEAPRGDVLFPANVGPERAPVFSCLLFCAAAVLSERDGDGVPLEKWPAGVCKGHVMGGPRGGLQRTRQIAAARGGHGAQPEPCRVSERLRL